MNIHIPQSIQTVSELMLIANVDKRFVSPATSKIVVNAKQDTVMGSFPMTYNSTYVDWKDAMNILMNTTVGLKGDIPKHTKLPGKMVYSEIIPNNINVIKRKDDGGYQMRIVDGQIMDGTFGKSDIGNIIQKIWLEYGSMETNNFITDIQKMILQFLLRYGFTMSISYVVVPEEIHRSVKEIIETKRKETLTTITEYENDPYVMTTEAFEETLTKGLQAIQGNIEKVITNSFSSDNGIFIAITSGSSGTAMNTGQIIGCIGQVIVEGKRIQKKFNGRTLPMFNKFDDGAFARGFCHNSFISGLSPPEFFFQVMAGREGIINTAIKTADKPQNLWAIL